MGACSPIAAGEASLRRYSEAVTRFPKLICLGLGLVSATGFAPLGWWPLTLIAFALLMAVVQQAGSLKAALARGYSFGVGHFVVGLNWIAGSFRYQETMPAWLGWIAVVALALYLAVYPALAAGLAWRWGREKPAAFVLFFAAAWIVTEWLRATMFTGFAWNPLGVALLDVGLEVETLSTKVGTYGLSGIAIILAGLLGFGSVWWVSEIRRLWRKGDGTWPTALFAPTVGLFLIWFVEFGIPKAFWEAGSSRRSRSCW